jgi:hypothetical protein
MKQIVSKRALGIFTWVLILIAVPAGLYVSHVFNQLSEVRSNNLRTLSKAAESTTEAFATILQNVRNLQDHDDFVCEFLKRQPYLEWGGSGGCAREQGTGLFRDAYLRGDNAGVRVIVDTAADSVKGYTFEVDLDALLKAIPFSDALDLLVIADEDGDVIHQHRPEGRLDIGLRLSSLAGLPAGVEGDLTQKDGLTRSSSISRVRLSGTDYQLLCQPIVLALGLNGDELSPEDRVAKAKAGAARSQTWVLCGLVASERALRASLAVAPFLALIFLAITVFGFLTWPVLKLIWIDKRDRLYFLDLYFLLLGTIGSLMLATILILGVGAYRSLVASSEESLQRLAGQIGSNLAAEIDYLANTARAFDRALEQNLSGQDPESEGTPSVPDIDRLYGVQVENWKELFGREIDWPVESDFEMIFWVDCGGWQRLKATPLDKNTPRVDLGQRKYFKAAVQDRLWVDPGRGNADGRFVEAVRSVTTGKFATIVSIRSAVDSGQLFRADASEDKKPPDIDCGAGVAAIQATLVAASNTVLAPGLGFAVIDRDGRVVLHSDERRALFENLYEEMEDGERLRAIVLARATENISTSYLGRPHRVFATPLENLPWTVVTFSDKELVNTATLEILGHSAALSFGVVLAYAVLALLYFLLVGPVMHHWFWPGSHNGRMAKWTLGIPGAAVALLIAAMVFGNDDWSVVTAIVLPFLVFAGILIAYEPQLKENCPVVCSSDVDRKQVSLAMLSSLLVWLVVAILPAMIFFDSAMKSQSHLVVKYSDEVVTERMIARNCAIEDRYRGVDRSGFGCAKGDTLCALQWRRSPAAKDLYPGSMLAAAEFMSGIDRGACGDAPESVRTAAGSQTPGAEPGLEPYRSYAAENPMMSSVWEFLATNAPIYNRTVARSRYLAHDVRAESRHGARRSLCSDPAGSVHFIATDLPCATSVHIDSGLPLGPGIYRHAGVGILGLLSLGILLVWVRYGVRSLFFGDLRIPPREDRAGLIGWLAEQENDSHVRLIAIAASQYDRADLLRQPGPQAAAENGTATAKSGQFSRHDMTDYFAGGERRERLLANLERDVAAGTNTLLVSPADPYDLLPARGAFPAGDGKDPQSQPDPAADDAALLRWRQLLGYFRVVIVSINKEPPAPAHTAIWRRQPDREIDPDWLRKELEALPEIEPLDELLRRELVGSSLRNALDRIVERAYGSYMALWDSCSDDEKLVLVQLAYENVVNPKSVVVVRRLIQRGLLVRDPILRIMNQSFARFVTQVQDPSEVHAWEHAATGMSWANLRWGLLGVLLVALLFLWATQRELFNSTMMFMSAAAVGLPGILKLLSSLSKSGAQEKN